jgi:putative endonuclease
VPGDARGRIVQGASPIDWPSVTLPQEVITSVRSRRGQVADQRGRSAESAAQSALERDGWNILARRLRTSAGEIDMVAEKEGLLAIVEVKARARLADAAVSLSDRQQARLISATEIVLANNPQWGVAGVRFDLLLVDAAGVVRRIADAFRGNG